jgi:hypothetical protein
VIFAAITLCIVSQRVYCCCCLFRYDSVRKFLVTSSYKSISIISSFAWYFPRNQFWSLAGIPKIRNTLFMRMEAWGKKDEKFQLAYPPSCLEVKRTQYFNFQDRLAVPTCNWLLNFASVTRFYFLSKSGLDMRFSDVFLALLSVTYDLWSCTVEKSLLDTRRLWNAQLSYWLTD